MEAPSGERLRGKGRHGVLCRLKAVLSMPERFKVVCTMQGAIQVLCSAFLRHSVEMFCFSYVLKTYIFQNCRHNSNSSFFRLIFAVVRTDKKCMQLDDVFT